MSRDDGGKGGGKGKKRHWSEVAPPPRSAKGGGKGKKRRAGTSGCFNCGEKGHMARDCPKPKAEQKSAV